MELAVSSGFDGRLVNLGLAQLELRPRSIVGPRVVPEERGAEELALTVTPGKGGVASRLCLSKSSRVTYAGNQPLDRARSTAEPASNLTLTQPGHRKAAM